MVAVALLSLIILGLVLMFVQTQRAFKTSMTQKDVLERGRIVTDMIARELAEMTPSDMANTTNFYAELSAQPTYQALPGMPNGYRTNFLQRFFFLSKLNQDWLGIGYQVVPDSPGAGVGTLYRYIADARGPEVQLLSATFQRALALGDVTNAIADGIVDLRLRAFDPNGWAITPYWPTNSVMDINTTRYWNLNARDQVDSYYRSNAVPASLELEVGILEPGALDEYRALSDAGAVAQGQYLTNHASQVHLFRERIPIRNVDPTAFQ